MAFFQKCPAASLAVLAQLVQLEELSRDPECHESLIEGVVGGTVDRFAAPLLLFLLLVAAPL